MWLIRSNTEYIVFVLFSIKYIQSILFCWGVYYHVYWILGLDMCELSRLCCGGIYRIACRWYVVIYDQVPNLIQFPKRKSISVWVSSFCTRLWNHGSNPWDYTANHVRVMDDAALPVTWHQEKTITSELPTTLVYAEPKFPRPRSPSKGVT